MSDMSALRRILITIHDTRGGATISFAVAFPIFLFIVGVLVQYALIVNAKLVIDNAAQQAARAAVTSLPEGKPDNVRAAAFMALAPICPSAKDSVTADAIALAQSLRTLGVSVPDSFSARYTYASEAARVTWDPNIDYTRSPSRELTMKVIYRFYLTVPGAARVVGTASNVGGVSGMFIDLLSTCQVQTSHSRAAFTDGSGWPH